MAVCAPAFFLKITFLDVKYRGETELPPKTTACLLVLSARSSTADYPYPASRSSKFHAFFSEFSCCRRTIAIRKRGAGFLAPNAWMGVRKRPLPFRQPQLHPSLLCLRLGSINWAGMRLCGRGCGRNRAATRRRCMSNGGIRLIDEQEREVRYAHCPCQSVF